MANVIFLDIEGVVFTGCYSGEADLNSVKNGSRFDPLAIYWLNRLVMETGADVVITSTWRYIFNLSQLRQQFSSAGFRGNVVDYIPIDIDVPRSRNIRRWMYTNEVDQFVIIDDVADDLAKVFPDRFIRTSYHRGLTFETYAQSKAILLDSTEIAV